MRKMNRFIPVALACAIFAAQPVQAATIIRDSDKQATSQNKQTTNTTQNPQAGNEGGPGYEDSKPNTSNNTTNTTGQSQVSAEAKAAADAIAKPTISAEAGILYDVTNGRVLFEKNADEKLAPASTTKLIRYARTGVFSCLKINRRVLSPGTGICYNLHLHANAHLRAR